MSIFAYFFAFLSVISLLCAAGTFYLKADPASGEYSGFQWLTGGIGAGLIAFFFWPTGGGETPTAGLTAADICPPRIQARLSNPSSFNASSISDQLVGGRVRIVVDFTAENAFGTKLRQRGVCIVDGYDVDVEISDR